MRPASRVTNFECIDVKDLRVTAASLRLRRIVIGLSIAYILVFTPIVGYFIWNYMMAQPQLPKYDDAGGASGKACINRRLPMHFAFHRGRGNGTAPIHHGNNHLAEWPSTDKRLGLVANVLGSRQGVQANSVGTENQGGNGSHVVPARDSLQQAAVAVAETSGQKALESAPIQRDVSVSDYRAFPGGASANAPTAENHLMHREQWPELGEQLEAGGQKSRDATQRDHRLLPQSINRLPVRIANQEMAPGDGLQKNGDDGPILAKLPGAVDVGPLYSEVNHHDGIRKELKSHLDKVREPALLHHISKQRLNKENVDRGDKVPASNKAGVTGALELDQKHRNENRKKGLKSEQSTSEVEKARAASALQEDNRRNPHKKEQIYALSEVDTGEEVAVNEGTDRVLSATGQGRISRPEDRKGANADGLPSSGVSENKSDVELRRRHSERLKFKLKKYRRMAKAASDAMTKAAVDGKRRDASKMMRQLNLGLQKELSWKTSGQDAHQKSWLPSDGLRTHREQNGSAASSTDNTDEQRMIRGMPYSGKDDNEVLSFAEFFKKHLSSKQVPSKVREGLRAVPGRRLMIDYLTKKKVNKEGLTEGIVAGGWPEKPQEPPPTKYTLDLFHPYIARRGPGWDFYDPLKPPTERNNARELAEQEFYSPEQPSGELQDGPTVMLAPVLPSNQSSIHGAVASRRQEEARHLKEGSTGGADAGGVRKMFDAPNSNVGRAYKPWIDKKAANSSFNKGQSLSDRHGNSRKNDVRHSFQQPVKSGFPRNGRENDFGNSVPIFPSEHELPGIAGEVGRPIRSYNKGTVAGSSKRGEAKYVTLAAANDSVNLSAKSRVGTGNDIYPGHPGDTKQAATQVVLSTTDGGKGNTLIEMVSSEMPIRHIDTSFGVVMKKALPLETTSKTRLPLAGIHVSEASGNQNGSQGNFVRGALEANVGEPNMTIREGNDRGSKESPRLLYAEPIPIEVPGYNVPNDNLTTAGPDADDAAREIEPNSYDDMVPSEDRNVIWSAPREGHILTGARPDDISLPGRNVTSQAARKYEDYTYVDPAPPDVAIANPPRDDVRRHDSGVSSVEPLPAEGPATGLIGSELENDFEDARAENKHIEIEAVTAKKREPFSEPPGVDVLIQNRAGTTGRTASELVPLDKELRPGVPTIFHKRLSSLPTGSTRLSPEAKSSSKKENLKVDVQSPGSVAAHAYTASFPKLETVSTGASSEQPIESAINITDRLRRNIANSSATGFTDNVTKPSRSVSDGLKDVEKVSTHPAYRPTSPGMRSDIQNMSMEGTKHHTTPSASHNVTPATSSAIHITIEVIKKRSDSKNDLNTFRRKKRKMRPSENPVSLTKSSKITTEASSPRGNSRNHVEKDIISTASSGGSHKSKAEGHDTLSTALSFKPAVEAANHSASSTQITEPSVSLINTGVFEKIPERERPPRQTSSNAPEVSMGSVTDKENSSMNEVARNSMNHQTEPSEHDTTTHSYAKALNELKKIAQNSTSPTPPTKAVAEISSRLPAYTGDSKPTEPVANKRGLAKTEVTSEGDVTTLEAKKTTASPSSTSPAFPMSLSTERKHAGTIGDAKKTWHSNGEMTTVKNGKVTTGKHETPPTQAHSTQVLFSRKDDVPDAGKNLVSLDNGTKASRAASPTTALRRNSDNSIDFKMFETTDGKATMLRLTNKALSTIARSSTKAPPFRTAPKTDPISTTSSQTTDTPTPLMKTVDPSSTKAPPFRTAPRSGTSNETLNETSETPVPEMKFEDMMGVFDDDDKASRDTSGMKSTVGDKRSTEHAPDSIERRVSTGTALNPRLIVVRTSTPKFSESPTPVEEVLKPWLIVVRRGSSTSETEGNARTRADAHSAATATTTVEAEPTALEFPGEYGEYDEETEARMHFPMVKIRRRPSTTRRRLAMMDLFGRGVPAARRTSLHPRLQHRIAVRRGHYTSPRTWPFQMTLFHDEPLNAVRIAVKRRG